MTAIISTLFTIVNRAVTCSRSPRKALGFDIDEPLGAPGESLKLPEWFESNRLAIEQDLPPIILQPIEKVKYEVDHPYSVTYKF